jgi:hypothetical protein
MNYTIYTCLTKVKNKPNTNPIWGRKRLIQSQYKVDSNPIQIYPRHVLSCFGVYPRVYLHGSSAGGWGKKPIAASLLTDLKISVTLQSKNRQNQNCNQFLTKENLKMNRREFFKAGSLAGIASMSPLTAAAMGGQSKQEYLELRKYRLHVGPKKNRLGNFLRDVGIPAMNRIGIKPVGVFSAMYGPNNPTLYVLLVHKSLDTVMNSALLLMQDQEYLKAGADFINAPLSEPAFVRMESSLMIAFKDMPKLEVPEKKSRIFELRTYESHSIKAAKKKIEMFNEGGEIAIFKKTGLQPVFFGETLIGPLMPNLTYMLVFENMADRDAKWKVFGGDPGWKKLRSNPAYRDTVSNITDIILRPASYSQI